MEISKRFVNVDLFADKYFDPEEKTTRGQEKPLISFKNISADFVIQKSRNAVISNATINIYNLSKENIGFFTSFKNETVLGLQQRRIRLSAGYEGQKEAILFNGDILQALPTMRPDIVLQCDCYSNFRANMGVQTLQMYGPIKLKDVCQKIAEKLKLGFEWTADEKNNKTIDSFTFAGGIFENVLFKLNKCGDICAYYEDGYLKVSDKNASRKSTDILEVNKSTGMIGLPRPSMFGVDVTVLLNPAIKLGQQIHLVSEAIPSCNGNYYVYGLTHRGSYRGNAFYTELQCLNFNS